MTVPGQDPLFAMMGGGGPEPEYTLLATDKVRFVGDPVAIVVAESRYLAEDGCELVEVDYEDLPPVASAAVALDAGSPRLFANLGDNIIGPHKRSEFGDVAGTFAAADRVAEFHIDVHRHQNVPMEGRGCVASYDADSGVMTVHAATQGVHMTRMGVATRLGIEPDKVRVLAGDIGGSFGLKIGASREELAVAAASRALGRPVKWIEDRSENLTASGQAREESFDVRAAVSNDGDLLGLDVTMVIDTGAYPVMGTMVAGDHRGDAARPVQARGAGLRVDRGHHQQGVVHRLPRPVGVRDVRAGARPRPAREGPRPRPAGDPAAQRRPAHRARRSSWSPGARWPASPPGSRWSASPRWSTSRPSGAGRPQNAPGAGTWASAWRPSSRPRPARARPRRPSGPMGLEYMRLRLAEDGIVTLFTGQMPHGQSHQTTLAQIAADEFGVPFEQVRVVVGDSDVGAVRVHGRQPVGHHDRRRDAARRPAAQGARCSTSRRSSSRPAPRTSRSPTARSWCAATPTARSRSARSPGRPRRGSSVPTSTPASRSRPRSTAAKAAGRAAATAPSSRSTSRPAS